MTQPTIAQLHNLTDRAATGLSNDEQQRLRDGINQLHAERDAARATNRRLNLRAQKLEAELATYRRAVDQWEINERGTYIPHASLRAIGKACGVDILGSVRHLKHFERVEQAEAALARIQALADEHPAGIDTALIHEALDQPGPATTQATEPAGLRARIAHTLRTTPNRHATNQLGFPDHHGPSEGYLGWCALCTRDVDALAEALLAAVTEHLDIGEEQAWCKTCRRAWDSPAHRCESDAEIAITQVRSAIAERLAEVADWEAENEPSAWSDAVTVTCNRIEDALRVFPEPVGIRVEPAHNDGPSIREAAADDRRWPLQKTGE